MECTLAQAITDINGVLLIFLLINLFWAIIFSVHYVGTEKKIRGILKRNEKEVK